MMIFSAERAFTNGKHVNFADACKMLRCGYEDDELREFLINEILCEIEEQIRSEKDELYDF